MIIRRIKWESEMTYSKYIITTQSGHQWLIERAKSERGALRQYYCGDAEPHTRVDRYDDRYQDGDHAKYLRSMGQAG